MPVPGRFINQCTCIQQWLSYNVQNNQHLFFYFINSFQKQFLIHVGIKISLILSGVNATMSCFHFVSGQSVSVISSEWRAPATSPHGRHYDQWHPYNWGNGLTMDFFIYINFPNITFTWKCTWFFFQLSFPIFLASLNLLGLKPENPGWNAVHPKKYAHGFVVLCFVVVMQSFIMNSHEVFIHIYQGCFAGTGAIVRLPQCQWSKPDEYGKISQCITTTKHSKAKTACIFLGIYCTSIPWPLIPWPLAWPGYQQP